MAMASEASVGAAARGGKGSASSGSGARRDSMNRWLGLAAVSGAVHADFTLYWAAGGTWLLNTLGARMVGHCPCCRSDTSRRHICTITAFALR